MCLDRTRDALESLWCYRPALNESLNVKLVGEVNSKVPARFVGSQTQRG